MPNAHRSITTISSQEQSTNWSVGSVLRLTGQIPMYHLYEKLFFGISCCLRCLWPQITSPFIEPPNIPKLSA